MFNHPDINFEELSAKIKEFLYSYVEVESFTSSENERRVDSFFLDYFSKVDYFAKHPENFGLYKIEDDVYRRNVCWAMVKGCSKDTIVMVHHYDVVGTEDFKHLKDLAFSPDELKNALKSASEMFSDEVKKDLQDDTFTFGRGSADMKGGGSIQYMLLEEYSKYTDFPGNIIVIGVPDEENLSAGMRAAVKLLAELKKKYDLNYKIMINSEPHQRKNPAVGVLSEGSIGKLMPFVYVRGFLAHVGKVFEGLNPVNIMSEIVRRTELNMDLADLVYPENAPAPTWLYMRDSKETYDVSMPLSVCGCLSVLTLTQTPLQLMEKIRDICVSSFDAVINDMNHSYRVFLKNTGRPLKELPWETSVVSFKELYDTAVKDSGKRFTDTYDSLLADLKNQIESGATTVIAANFRLIDIIFDYVNDISPKVVYGLVPPYYPNVANINLDISDDSIRHLSRSLSHYSEENFAMSYEKEYYYTGISDLSYTYIEDADDIKTALKNCMPLFDNIYKLPVDDISFISMPCINIGPWGKDFHKLTERVNTEDLLIRTPRLVDKAVQIILGQ